MFNFNQHIRKGNIFALCVNFNDTKIQEEFKTAAMKTYGKNKEYYSLSFFDATEEGEGSGLIPTTEILLSDGSTVEVLPYIPKDALAGWSDRQSLALPVVVDGVTTGETVYLEWAIDLSDKSAIAIVEEGYRLIYKMTEQLLFF